MAAPDGGEVVLGATWMAPWGATSGAFGVIWMAPWGAITGGIEGTWTETWGVIVTLGAA